MFLSGTSHKTNPMAVATFQKNSIFTNVAETANGEYYWEGLEDEIADKVRRRRYNLKKKKKFEVQLAKAFSCPNNKFTKNQR